jgi:hypothetical protein
MRFAPLLAISALLASFACKAPEDKQFREAPPPVEVSVSFKADTAAGLDTERELAAALRARLAGFVTVVPEGTVAPPGAVRLEIEINRVRRGRISPVFIGAAVGVTVGILSAFSGNRDGIATLDGLYHGLWAASEAEAGQARNEQKLGYVPPRLGGLVSLGHPGNSRPLFMSRIPTWAIIDQMAPLRQGERHDPAAINEALARAFATAIVNMLQERFEWKAAGTPSWYEAPESLSRRPANYERGAKDCGQRVGNWHALAVLAAGADVEMFQVIAYPGKLF